MLDWLVEAFPPHEKLNMEESLHILYKLIRRVTKDVRDKVFLNMKP